jgi:hypothetical protein
MYLAIHIFKVMWCILIGHKRGYTESHKGRIHRKSKWWDPLCMNGYLLPSHLPNGGIRVSGRGRFAGGGGSRAGAGQQDMARDEVSSHPSFGDRLGVGFLTC